VLQAIDLNIELKHQARHDELTKIPNRRYFLEQLHTAWQSALRHKTPITVVMLDIDYFKKINDTYGHKKGDECLQIVGRILEIKEIKSVPYRPISHPFVERLIGTIRREYLDQTLFWNVLELERKPVDFEFYYRHHRTHNSLGGATPAEMAGGKSTSLIKLSNFRWQTQRGGLYQSPHRGLNTNSPWTASEHFVRQLTHPALKFISPIGSLCLRKPAQCRMHR
jgi:hypothetical protein